MTNKSSLKRLLIALMGVMLVLTNLQGSEAELISLSDNVSFRDVIKIFDTYYRQYDDKVLLDLSDYTGTIGINIDRIHWRAALYSILAKNDLVLTERENAFLINKKEEPKTAEELKFIDSVLIEATFFEADFNVVRELGIDWSTFIDGDVRLRTSLRTTDQMTQDLFSAVFDRTIESGNNTIDINTLFKALSAHDKGHIISRPQITVMSGETGTVQDGMDYTILVPGRTALGDEVAQAHEVSVQSGTIVHVTPVVILDEDGEKAVNLNIRVERSTAQPDVTGYSKRTSEVHSQKVLYNGEETIIGGLTTKESLHIRKGLPILKDLPWWVFGIRFLTGYSRTEIYNKELIILIKTTILPASHERKRIRRDVVEEIERQRQGIPEIEPKLLQ